MSATAISLAETPALAADAQLVVNAGTAGPALSPTQFGHILEDINHSVEGGLNANLVRNSDMKENNATPPAFWSLVTAGGGTGSITRDTVQPVHPANPSSLRLSIATNGSGQRVGVANGGFFGIGLRPSTTYRASFFARTDGAFAGPLTVGLESTGGTVFASATVSGLSTSWQRFSVSLTTSGSTPVSSGNRFVISANGIGAGRSVWLNIVTCYPPTFAAQGNLRADLMQKMADTAPGFVRVPGGNYLEGNTVATRFNWKTTIGPLETRPGHQNDAWGYWSTDQLGLLEYLELAEQMHAQPLLGVYAGYSLAQVVVPQNQLQPFIQDALDEIEYVIGATTTTWGARRAADGHPAPFPLTYVEIGNEDQFDNSGSYNAYRYPMFYDAIKARFPQLQVVATTNVTSRPMDVIDDHLYNNSPSFFVGQAHRYDNTSRTGPKHLVGEFGVTNGTGGNPTGTLGGAIGEAAYLTGLVRNADVVIGAAFAPVLAHVNSFQWSTNLIGFNASTSYGSPSYYVQRMFGTLHGDHVVGAAMSGADASVATVATRAGTGTTYVTVVNPTATVYTTAVTVTGASSVGATATATTLTGNPAAVNSITAPNTVVPVVSTIPAGVNFSHTFPPNSVTVLTLPTSGAPAPPTVPVNQPLSLRATTSGFTDRYVTTSANLGVTAVVTSGSTTAQKQAATFVVRPGLAQASCYSFESRTVAGQFLRHRNFRVELGANDGTALFRSDATFCAQPGNSGQGLSWQSINFPTRYLRHFNNELWISSNGGTMPSDATANWANDTTWINATPWAP
jgi:hypothetical protein